MMTAEELFTHLLKNKRLITYSGAYCQLFGENPERWNQKHAGAVLRRAKQTKPQEVFPGIMLRLDSLIVLDKGDGPSDGYFDEKKNTEPFIHKFSVWRVMFKGWNRW